MTQVTLLSTKFCRKGDARSEYFKLIYIEKQLSYQNNVLAYCPVNQTCWPAARRRGERISGLTQSSEKRPAREHAWITMEVCLKVDLKTLKIGRASCSECD